MKRNVASSEMFRMFAKYNEWMNQKVYTGAGDISDEQLKEDKHAFFGSLFGTLNHLMFGDLFLLTRIREYLPDAGSLAGLSEQWEFEPTKIYNSDLAGLTERRVELDRTIISLTDSLSDSILDKSHQAPPEGSMPLWVILLHMFNHQTHHRGQATTLLSQCGVDIGVTDLNDCFVELNELPIRMKERI